ncbi:MAG: DUF6125 family protein [Ignavibacteria bacterium]|nr:DUF6125 family protein [Ignavibacteria bacterium]
MEIEKIEDLSKDELYELLKIYARNWLAHDGSWFLAIESELGLEKAIHFDTKAWETFTKIEAKRIKEFLNLPDEPGLEGLRIALNFRLYSTLNEQFSKYESPTSLLYFVRTCRVQEARRRKGLPDFPCQSVGLVEYSLFAKTIDTRIKTTSVSCPPNISKPEFFCVWKFELINE